MSRNLRDVVLTPEQKHVLKRIVLGLQRQEARQRFVSKKSGSKRSSKKFTKGNAFLGG
jgi:hypothetical protein